MPVPANVEIEVHLEDSGTLGSMPDEVREGLTASPKWLPSKYFYDERGSELFERITRLPEYYLTRAELSILRSQARRIARITGFEELVELGSGAATKTRVLIDAGLDEGSLRRFTPVEVSLEIAERAAHAMALRYPDLDIHAVVGDFEKHLGRVPDGGRRMVAFLGSTIGNFIETDAIGFLRKIRSLLDDSDWLLLGTDLVKEARRLEAAYNDEQGVTADFNRNILQVINRHLGADFEPRRFEHVSYFADQKSRIESYLCSTIDQNVRLEDLNLDVMFVENEMLLTEVSCKYDRGKVARMLELAGLQLVHWFTDDENQFALSLARPVHTVTG